MSYIVTSLFFRKIVQRLKGNITAEVQLENRDYECNISPTRSSVSDCQQNKSEI